MKNKLSLLVVLGCCAVDGAMGTRGAVAQVTPDDTTNTTVDTNGNDFTIEDGDRAGSNLFHSFRDFSVPNGGSAFFNNAEAIQNIFSRVTGGNISNIDGLIRANSANLFLINPAGIVFGQGARLDIGGSFYGSTADSILFPDGIEFSATDTQQPVLTVNAPIGLNFRDDPRDIVNRAGFIEVENGDPIEEAGLEVNRGEAITLVGGSINLENGRLTAPGGRIELGGLAEAGIIEFGEDLRLNFSDELTRADVSLTGIAEIDVTSGGGGDISIFANNIDILDGSDICAGIGADSACGERNSDLGSVDAQAGDITFDAIEVITIEGGFSDVNNILNADSMGNAGNINIKANSLVVRNGGGISATTNGQGNSGSINILARDLVVFQDAENNTFIQSNIGSSGVGDSGGVNIATDSLSITNGAQIQSVVFGGEGNSGKIIIDSNTVSLDGRDAEDFPSGVFSVVTEGSNGNAGGLEITANSLFITNRAQLQSNTAGMGNAGNIDLFVENEVNLVDSLILSEVTEGTGIGDGGNIDIKTGSLLLREGSALLADTENIGDAGNIIIEAGEQVVLEGEGAIDGFPSQITATVDDFEGATGEGGNIDISTPSLTVKDDGFIEATAFGQGNAGDINIVADELFMTGGVGIRARTFGQGDAGRIDIKSQNIDMNNDSAIQNVTGAQGNASNLTISTNVLSLSEGSNIAASTLGQGDAGQVSINANDSIFLDGEAPDGFNSGIFSTVELDGEGSAGGIEVSTTNLFITNGAEIDVSVIGQGNAGNAVINVSDRILIDGVDRIEDSNSFRSDSGIFASVDDDAVGNGGNLNINAGSLIIRNGGEINASAGGQGNGGNLTLAISDNLILSNNGLISAEAFDDATGGNVDINAEFIVATPNQNNDIIASATEGRGGNINITAEALFGIEERPQNPVTNDIDASSEFGLDGNVSINIFDVDPLRGAAELPTNVIEPQQTTVQACATEGESVAQSKLVIQGKGGIPPEPTAPLNSDVIITNEETASNLQSQHPENKPIKTQYSEIVPARGAAKTKDGRVILTAYPTDNIDTRTPNISGGCS